MAASGRLVSCARAHESKRAFLHDNMQKFSTLFAQKFLKSFFLLFVLFGASKIRRYIQNCMMIDFSSIRARAHKQKSKAKKCSRFLRATKLPIGILILSAFKLRWRSRASVSTVVRKYCECRFWAASAKFALRVDRRRRQNVELLRPVCNTRRSRPRKCDEWRRPRAFWRQRWLPRFYSRLRPFCTFKTPLAVERHRLRWRKTMSAASYAQLIVVAQLEQMQPQFLRRVFNHDNILYKISFLNSCYFIARLCSALFCFKISRYSSNILLMNSKQRCELLDSSSISRIFFFLACSFHSFAYKMRE